MSAQAIADLGDFVIRPFRDEDADGFARHANNPAVIRWLRDRFPHPYAPSDARDFFLGIVAKSEAVNAFVLADADGAFGSIGVERYDDVNRMTAEIGFWVGEDHQGRGIATRAVEAMTKWAFATMDVERLEGMVFAPNVGSARVLEKAGYRLESRRRNAVFKHGELLDDLVFVRLRGE